MKSSARFELCSKSHFKNYLIKNLARSPSVNMSINGGADLSRRPRSVSIIPINGVTRKKKRNWRRKNIVFLSQLWQLCVLPNMRMTWNPSSNYSRWRMLKNGVQDSKSVHSTTFPNRKNVEIFFSSSDKGIVRDRFNRFFFFAKKRFGCCSLLLLAAGTTQRPAGQSHQHKTFDDITKSRKQKIMMLQKTAFDEIVSSPGKLTERDHHFSTETKKKSRTAISTGSAQHIQLEWRWERKKWPVLPTCRSGSNKKNGRKCW